MLLDNEPKTAFLSHPEFLAVRCVVFVSVRALFLPSPSCPPPLRQSLRG